MTPAMTRLRHGGSATGLDRRARARPLGKLQFSICSCSGIGEFAGDQQAKGSPG